MVRSSAHAKPRRPAGIVLATDRPISAWGGDAAAAEYRSIPSRSSSCGWMTTAAGSGSWRSRPGLSAAATDAGCNSKTTPCSRLP